MRILLVADRLSTRGGGDHYWLDLCTVLHSMGHEIRLLVGRKEVDWEPSECVFVLRGLARPTASKARLAGLDAHISWADRVVVQGVMNPVPLERLSASHKAIFVVQDHRHFCPGQGKTLPGGQVCEKVMSDSMCEVCLPDSDYRLRLLELTQARIRAIADAPIVVLSAYMAAEMRRMDETVHIIPPFVRVMPGGVYRNSGTAFFGGSIGAAQEADSSGAGLERLEHDGDVVGGWRGSEWKKCDGWRQTLRVECRFWDG